MAIADIQTSFAAGELSPQLYARVDLDKFQVGAALLRNFFVDYRGGASNRPGTEYIDATSEGARLIPFIVSTDAAYVLVFTNLLITIYNRGVLVTTVVTPYLTEDLFTIQYTQSADVLTLVHPSYAPADLSRTSSTTFTYTPIVIGPSLDPPIMTTFRAPHNQDYCYGYVITAVDAEGKEESLPSNIGTKISLVLNEFQNVVIGMTWTAPSQPVSRYNVYKWGPNDNATMSPSTTWGFIGSAVACTFTDNNIAADFSKQPPNYGDPFSGGQFASITVSNGGAGYTSTGNFPNIPYVPLVITGDGTGAAGWAVLDNATHKIIGVFLTNPGKNYTAATVTAVGQGGTGATFTYTFTDPDPLYPGATAYLQQRRVFGGSTLKPETLVMSQPGLYNNFNSTPVVLATDAITMSIAAEEVNSIKSFVQVNYGLIAFTTGGSFLINGGTPGAAIDANSPSIQPQVSQGANNLRPLRINYDVIYGQAKGNRIHNLAFAWQKQAYAGSDVSTLAAHLFDGFTTVDWTYAEEPYKIVWAVRSDGRLLSLTYVPEQDVYAWARHDTQGLFKSICSVPEGGTDAVYVIVERHIPGHTPCWVYYLERLHERLGCCILDAWFLDSALELPRTQGTSDLFIIGDTTTVDSTVTIYSYDPCGDPPVGPGPFDNTAYTLEARQAYDAASAARELAAFNALDSSLNDPGGFCNKEDLAFGYDRVNEKIIYGIQLEAYNNPVTNTTGRVLTTGTTKTVGIGGTYDSDLYGNYNVAVKDVVSGAITLHNVYSATQNVPAGVHGSDGTYGYLTDTINLKYTGPTLVDPRTSNLWVHTYGTDLFCSIIGFEANIQYQQRIFPWGPDTSSGSAHMELAGMSDNWVYALNGDLVLLTPRLLEAGELGAGYVSTYAKYTLPFDINAAFQARWCFTSANKMFAAWTATGVMTAREYFLLKVDEPTSAPFGGPVVGGGVTDITPWGPATGPNSNIAAWNAAAAPFYDLLLYNIGSSNLAFVTKLTPVQATGGGTDPTFFRCDCTYVPTAGGSFDYHEKWMYGFMKGTTAATFEVAADVTTADWVIEELLEVDQDINMHSFAFPGVNYARRTFFAIVQPVVAGAWTYDTASRMILVLTYDFISGAAPLCTGFISGQHWDDAYTVATGVPHPAYQVINNWDAQSSFWLENGFWSPTDQAWWFSGAENFMATLDPTFEYETWNNWSGPLVRYALATAPIGDCIVTDCGMLHIASTISDKEITATIEVPFDNTLPDDPTTNAPIPASGWTYSTKSQIVSGLDHLEGKTVYALADGEVLGPFTVTGGEVDIGVEACVIVVGLKYTQQIQTLYLTTDGIQQGSDQGKRKLITGVTLRVDCTRGLKVGTDFGSMLTPIEELNAGVLFTGDARALTFPQWDERGETCIEQDFPLPATVLGVIVEVTPGDTGS